MRVRHKLTEEEYTVRNTALDSRGTKYHAFDELDGFYPAGAYEPIPVETWRDVTTECRWQEGWATIVHAPVGTVGTGEKRVFQIKADEGYRLRKVKVFDEAGQNLLNRDAFIIERKEP